MEYIYVFMGIYYNFKDGIRQTRVDMVPSVSIHNLSSSPGFDILIY